jgi:hypothetical protein
MEMETYQMDSPEEFLGCVIYFCLWDFAIQRGQKPKDITFISSWWKYRTVFEFFTIWFQIYKVSLSFFLFYLLPGRRVKKMMHKTSRTKHFFVLFSKAYPFIIIFHNWIENILESYLSSYFISRIHLVSCGKCFF